MKTLVYKRVTKTGKLVEFKYSESKNSIVRSCEWYTNPSGYIVSAKRAPQYLHRMLTNALTGEYVDHVSGDKLDNTDDNLRICTNSQNNANIGLKKNNTSGYKGVFFNTRLNKWQARVTFNRKQIHCGVFNHKNEAAAAYNKKAKECFGDFAKLNIII